MVRAHALSTFSIVAHDAVTGELGIAVASRFLSVGAVVPWAAAGVGAIATQSFANTTYGPAGLALLAQGYASEDVLNGLLAADIERTHRQVGIVDGQGRAASFTGEHCMPWAGARTGERYAVQGNILIGPSVVDRMADTFESTSGQLPTRLVAALSAGQDAGGDSRGQQSAALLVVRSGGGYAGFNDREVDLRIDDHPAPVGELQRLLQLHDLYMGRTRDDDILEIDGDCARLIQNLLVRSGHRKKPATGVYDVETRQAFWSLCGAANLEGRWCEGRTVDRVVLEHLNRVYPDARGQESENREAPR